MMHVNSIVALMFFSALGCREGDLVCRRYAAEAGSESRRNLCSWTGESLRCEREDSITRETRETTYNSSADFILEGQTGRIHAVHDQETWVTFSTALATSIGYATRTESRTFQFNEGLLLAIQYEITKDYQPTGAASVTFSEWNENGLPVSAQTDMCAEAITLTYTEVAGEVLVSPEACTQDYQKMLPYRPEDDVETEDVQLAEVCQHK